MALKRQRFPSTSISLLKPSRNSNQNMIILIIKIHISSYPSDHFMEDRQSRSSFRIKYENNVANREREHIIKQTPNTSYSCM